MIKIKWGLLSGIIALAISLILGILFGVNIAIVLVRAVVFCAVFTALGIGLQVVIIHFIPELLNNNDEVKSAETGHKVNITLDNSVDFAVPDTYQKDSSDGQEIGNVKDLAVLSTSSQDMDFDGEDEYIINENESQPSQFSEGKPALVKSDFSVSFGDDSTGLGGLPDLASMASIFSSGSSSSSSLSTSSSSTESFGQAETAMPSKNKGTPLKGDFNPKEMAEGLRTVLSKDE
jgi:hypothetical protein